MTKKSIPIWLDCDPGNDDVFAILLVLFHPRFNLLGISTVHGNAPLHMTTHNTLGILDLLQVYNVKVYSGSSKPLSIPPHFAFGIHGTTGLGGVTLPKHTINQVTKDMDYIEAIRLAILENESEICLVCTGTLTNIYKLITKYPEVKDKIKYVAIMGGGFEFGNVTPYAEFNFHTDPHAAELVIHEFGNKVILTPLNLTHTVVATEYIRNQIYDKNKRSSNIRKFFRDILMFYGKAYAENFGMKQGPPLHDPLALYSLLPFVDDSFEEYGYKYVQQPIKVILDGEHQGETVKQQERETPGYI
ncbi:Uridine nucleosidase [Spathaspora sp. JA1]|nr:Uridine nucleosidase [Spathaspora sp. JA1]